MRHATLQFVLLLVLLGPSTARAQFDALSKNIQNGANAVLAIDVEAVLKTPLANKESWGKKLESAFVDRSIVLPPEARRVLHASTLRPDRNFESDNEISLLQVSRSPALATIARANGGRIEQIKGRDVVAGLTNAYVIPVSSDVLAVYSPANRQLAGRWIGELSGHGTTSAYLQKALGSSGPDGQIILAVDLADLLSEADVAEKLKAAKVLDGSSYKVETVAAQLQSIQGVTVQVAIGNDAKATLRVDFGIPVGVTVPVMKKIILTALDENGLKLDELDHAAFSISGNAVIAKADLSTGGLRRVLSLLAPPTPELLSEGSSVEPKSSSADTMAKASQAYFKTVVSLLDDLRGDRTKQDPRGGQDAVWMDKYAQKIDRLSVLNVDQDVVEWGTKTAQTLRVMATSRRGAGLSAGSQKSGLRSGAYYDSYYNSVSYTSGLAAARDANQIDVQTANIATAKRVEGWQLIDNATAELRKKETQRYGIDF